MFKTLSTPLASGGRLSAAFRTDPAAPNPIRQAVRLMYVGAAVSAISLILSVISSFSLKNDLISANAQNLKDHKVTMSQIDSLATAGIVYAIVVGLLSIGLWIWMGKMCEAGRSWARISSTVFFALWSFYTWVNLNSLKGTSVTVTASLLVSLALLLGIWVIGAVAIYYLWRPISTAYFKAQAK
jgi:hypothetical protein